MESFVIYVVGLLLVLFCFRAASVQILNANESLEEYDNQSSASRELDTSCVESNLDVTDFFTSH